MCIFESDCSMFAVLEQEKTVEFACHFLIVAETTHVSSFALSFRFPLIAFFLTLPCADAPVLILSFLASSFGL